MGQCLSSADKSTAGSTATNPDKYVKRILFWGPGGSGKSTICKQLRAIHGEGWYHEDRKDFIEPIHTQIIQQMQYALEFIQYPGNQEDDEEKQQDPDGQLSIEGQTAATVLQSVKDSRMTNEVAAAVKLLWDESGIKQVYDQRLEVRSMMLDSSAYFWDKIYEIINDGYCPSVEDIMRVYEPTTGVLQQRFTIKSMD